MTKKKTTKPLNLNNKEMQKKLEDSLNDGPLQGTQKADDILAMIRARQNEGRSGRIHYTEHLKFIQASLKALCQELLELNHDLVFDDESQVPFDPISDREKKDRINQNIVQMMIEIDDMPKYVQDRDLDAEREEQRKRSEHMKQMLESAQQKVKSDVKH